MLINQAQIIGLTDRQLIRNGRPIDSGGGKGMTVVGIDGRALVTFTGLAQYGSFDTRHWLIESIADERRRTKRVTYAIGGLAERLDEQVRRLRIPRADDRRLTVAVGAYLYPEPVTGGPHALAYFWQFSNFEPRRFDDVHYEDVGDFLVESTGFTIRNRAPGTVRVGVYLSGFHQLFRQEELASLRKLLFERRPADALIGKAVEAMRRVADDPRSEGKVGRDYTSATMPLDPDVPMVVDYHVGQPSTTAYLPSNVNLVTGTVLHEPMVDVGVGPPTRVPKTGRKAPCPCGSGLKYKRCHGVRTGPTSIIITLGE